MKHTIEMSRDEKIQECRDGLNLSAGFIVGTEFVDVDVMAIFARFNTLPMVKSVELSKNKKSYETQHCVQITCTNPRDKRRNLFIVEYGFDFESVLLSSMVRTLRKVGEK